MGAKYDADAIKEFMNEFCNPGTLLQLKDDGYCFIKGINSSEGVIYYENVSNANTCGYVYIYSPNIIRIGCFTRANILDKIEFVDIDITAVNKRKDINLIKHLAYVDTSREFRQVIDKINVLVDAVNDLRCNSSNHE